MRKDDLLKFIIERYSIWQRRQAGLAKPWTQDPILQNYRFCNVYREHDRETIWIAQNWRDPHTNDPHVWFAMTVARLVNWSPTLAELGYPVPWNPKHFQDILNGRKASGQKTFTGAYMIPAGHEAVSKAMFLAVNVLQPMWIDRDRIINEEATRSLAHFHKRLRQYKGMGNFLAGQVVCDTKYTNLLKNAPDWWTFAVQGPGSERGLNRVMERPVNNPWKRDEWELEMRKLKASLHQQLVDAGLEMHAQDFQ